MSEPIAATGRCDSATPANILVTGQQSEDNRRRIIEAAGDHPVTFFSSVAEAAPALPGAHAIAGTINAAQLAAAPELRWVHSWAAGANADLTPEMVDSPVVLTSSVGNGAVPLAEHSLLLMLMLDRDVPRWARAQGEHRWDRHTHGELNGKTLGIVGLGHSGADLAIKAQAFHMRVLGVRRRADLPVAGVDQIFPLTELHGFLAECDYVVVTAPLTPQTTGMFGESEFQVMKPTAFWICISRGGIADDDALLDALRRRRIAGAGLDAHAVEPLPEDSPFWDLPNVIVTPHNGATTAATAQRGVDIFVDNLRRFVGDEPLTNLVDKSAGY